MCGRVWEVEERLQCSTEGGKEGGQVECGGWTGWSSLTELPYDRSGLFKMIADHILHIHTADKANNAMSTVRKSTRSPASSNIFSAC